jgi:hypothetical protein
LGKEGEKLNEEKEVESSINDGSLNHIASITVQPIKKSEKQSIGLIAMFPQETTRVKSQEDMRRVTKWYAGILRDWMNGNPLGIDLMTRFVRVFKRMEMELCSIDAGNELFEKDEMDWKKTPENLKKRC